MIKELQIPCRSISKTIYLSGDYRRTRKDGRPFFDIRKMAQDLAKELLAAGAVRQVDCGWMPASDHYKYKVYVLAAMKHPGDFKDPWKDLVDGE